ncbi:MAG: beta strand repeat-containing protein [Blastocatellales bacterium]
MKNNRSTSQRYGLIMLLVTAILGFIGLVSISRISAQDDTRKMVPARMRSEDIFGPFDYDSFLEREKNGEFPFQGGDVPVISPYNSLSNNNSGSTATAFFTQSETSLVAFGNTVVIGFNDSGSNSGGTNKFTGFARSTDGGATFVDGGTLPTNPIGDAGDPVLARNEATGRIYFSTLGFGSPGTIQVFRSDDNGATWMAPVSGTPGGSSEDKQWLTVDNFAGAGNGNVYLLSRRFGSGPGIYFFSSTDNGSTYGPNGGTLIVAGSQGAYISVGPDHSIYAFWYAGTTLQMRKSTDFGATFGSAITVASGLVGGSNGDLSLTGIRQGTATAAGFRSNEFPHAAVNPVTGHIYVTYANNPAGTDKADVFLTQSTDGGATWAAPIRVNDDATTTDQWQPTLAVTPDGNNLGIFYYSRQEDTVNNNLFKFYGRTASISGATLTFTPSFAVSDVASLPEFGRDSVVNSTYMGDYDQAVGTPGAFHVVWSDSRDDLPGGGGRKDPNVYYKKISLTISVTTTVPAVASVISTQPTVFTVNVTEPINPATLQAGDFTVNGIPATGVAYTPGTTTATFSFAVSPVTAQGLQTMNVPAGAFTSAMAGDPVAAFTGTFRYDTLLLQVVSTTPPVGGVFSLPGPFTYDVTFNEPIDPASVQVGDLILSGIPGSSVTAVSVLPGNTTVRFTLNVNAEGALTATIPAGAITDVFGNLGAIFSGGYVVDIGTVPFPTPLLAKNPIGSLIYDPGISGNIGFAGDTDSFTLAIDPGQTVTALVSGSGGLQASIELRDPSSTVIGSATASGANLPALLQTAPAVTGGTYTFTVGGAGGTTGNFTLQVMLNAALEEEGTLAGITNNTTGTAQDISGSFINLQTSTASAYRGAVNGTTDSANYMATAVPFAFEDISGTGTVIAGLTGADDSSTSIPIGFTFSLYGTTSTSVFVSSNGLLTFGTGNSAFTNADLTSNPAQAAIAAFWDDQNTGGGDPASNVYYMVSGSGTNQHLTIQWNKVRFFASGNAGDTLTYQVQLYADGRIQFNYQDLIVGTAVGNNGASATVGVKDAGSQGANRLLLAFNNGPNAFVGTGQSTLLMPPNPTPDLYAFALVGNETNTLVAKSLSGAAVMIELLNSGGSVLATGASGFTNVDSVIGNYVAPSSGTYYVRVSSLASVPYNLVITRNAAFDSEDNNSAATAQPLAGNRAALGGLITGGAYGASAVTPVFEDISGSGTVIAGLTNQDDTSVSIPIGFTFPFYGVNNTAVFVSSNGLMTFGSANTAFTNTDLTSSPTQAVIAPFWDDQNTAGGDPGSNVLYAVTGSGANQHLTIQWNKVRFFTGGTAGDTLTYQVQLYVDGRIQFNYQDLVSGAAAQNNGASATVGIKGPGTQGPDRLLLAFNNGPNAYVGTGLSTLLSQSIPDDWYSLTAAQGVLRFETSTPADGPGEFVNILNPHIDLYDSTGTSLIASGAPLGDGRNEAINATGLTTGATYLVRVTSEGGTSGEYFLGVSLNIPPTIGTLAAARQQGSPASNSAIANVGDPDQPLNTLIVTINGGPSATLNGVTVSGLAISPAGVVTANIVASCTATNASFTVRVTDQVGAFAEATLNVMVTANTAPILGYGNQNVMAGNGATINPLSGPSDNGTITSITVLDKGTFTGGISVNAAGVVTVTNAAPLGNHIIKIRAIDNCGAMTDAVFNLAVSGLTAGIADPAICNGPGVVVDVTATVTNGSISAQPATFTATLPAGLLALPGTCAASTGVCTVNSATSVSWSGTLGGGQTVTITYKAQFGDQVLSGTQLCITSSASVGGSAPVGIQACATADCPAVGPGLPFPTASSVASDQKPGSVLIYNIYTSSMNPNAENTRINLTNVDPARTANVHLFFVDGASCSVADLYLCLSPNKTTSFLASDLDPGTTGYLVAVAVDDNGCPINFNYLIGDAYVKFASGHAANLAAISVAARAGAPPACGAASGEATIAFDGVSYDVLPYVLAADNIASRIDGNETMLVLNRIGGNLAIGPSRLAPLFGILIDDAENGLSFTLNPGTCQYRSILSNSTLRTVPRFEQFIPSGRSGWLKLWQTGGAFAMTGSMINYNRNAAATSNAFNQGHNLHALTTTSSMSYSIPVFPPGC